MAVEFVGGVCGTFTEVREMSRSVPGGARRNHGSISNDPNRLQVQLADISICEQDFFFLILWLQKYQVAMTTGERGIIPKTMVRFGY